MNEKFDKNGISFQFPGNWKLVDEEWNDQISALTFEDDNDRIFMIDIYHRGISPGLEEYANRHFRCFVDELPIISKLISEPTSSYVKEEGVSGIVLEFIIKSYMLFKTVYVNPIYKISGEKSVSFISAQYPKRMHSDSELSLKIVLSSYQAI